MNRLFIFAALLSTASFPLATEARAGISIIVTSGANNAEVYNVDTSTGAATFVQSIQDPSTASNNASPNALGVVNDTVFYTTFATSTSGEAFYRNNDQLLTLPVPTTGQSIAAGDAVGDTYYFVDRNGNLGTVNGIFGTATIGQSKAISGVGQPLGDLAVDANGEFGYVSYSNSNLFAQIDLADASVVGSAVNAGRRYVGLGFDGNTLFGVTSDFGLYQISLSSSNFGTGFFLTEITGTPTGWSVTDAARAVGPEGFEVIPEPGNLAMATLAVAGLLVGRRVRRRRPKA
jgi:hypothetical protein